MLYLSSIESGAWTLGTLLLPNHMTGYVPVEREEVNALLLHNYEKGLPWHLWRLGKD